MGQIPFPYRLRLGWLKDSEQPVLLASFPEHSQAKFRELQELGLVDIKSRRGDEYVSINTHGIKMFERNFMPMPEQTTAPQRSKDAPGAVAKNTAPAEPKEPRRAKTPKGDKTPEGPGTEPVGAKRRRGPGKKAKSQS